MLFFLKIKNLFVLFFFFIKTKAIQCKYLYLDKCTLYRCDEMNVGLLRHLFDPREIAMSRALYLLPSWKKST